MAPIAVSSVAIHIRADTSTAPSKPPSPSVLVTTLVVSLLGVSLVLAVVLAFLAVGPICKTVKDARGCRRERKKLTKRGPSLRSHPDVQSVAQLPRVYPHPLEPAAAYWQRQPRKPLTKLPELPRRVLEVKCEEAQLQMEAETGAEDMYLLLDENNQLSPIGSHCTATPNDCF
ncbi:hypothetical protein CMQ_1865 [Grosmannia clavigera kw1407]|uniref:Uncharacterized protein n=1 Tax=Grosmannia clavigera (strain kw1407 / UAMH 11150) TaxID=655863 RepID=F0XND0_GROCL|nr:uncharacterized protein CMQ_1865 [Grosmannia clavigera kw1407]EFX00784.1 hypothetical protein CMQ_1865 [Grosmannia clavigera kw1407]